MLLVFLHSLNLLAPNSISQLCSEFYYINYFLAFLRVSSLGKGIFVLFGLFMDRMFVFMGTLEHTVQQRY